ncbi:MAG: hypothetical protein IT372_26825 [Polyangiaceae bacterium]|nr:hypothetical protein [Polyangiaceae bacterium]
MRFPWTAAAASCLALGCGDATSVTSMWTVPASLDELREDHFFDAPWPSDLRLEGGAVRLAGYYNPRQMPLLAEYIAAMDGALDGFSPAAAGFLRFSAPLDPESLPESPLLTLSPFATVQLIDVDPSSPGRGGRRPVTVLWREAAGVYWLPNTLAFMPTLGFPLRPRTRYALVVTDAIRSADGGPALASDELRQALGLDAAGDRTAAARDALAPSIAEIEAAGIPRERIAHLTVFTTSDPTAELYAIRDHLHESVVAPRFRPAEWELRNVDSGRVEYVGMYGPSPDYQFGKIPYASYGDGGGFVFQDGEPVVSGLYDLRFSLTVPGAAACPMPEAGYPIVMYAHGTGGDYRSYVYDGTAKALAERCIASMGVDQIFHGRRRGSPDDPAEVDVLFFNFQNVVAARTNTRQSAIDEIQRARLFTEAHATVPAKVSVTGQEIRFDGSKLMFFGHSQGGLNGPLYLAADDSSRGGVLSGSSASLSITLLEKTKPSPSVAGLVETIFLGLRGDEVGEMSELHPAIALAQSIVDVVDPLQYARGVVTAPRPGFAPKSIYMTEGVNPDGTGDSYAPPHGIEVHGVAMGLPLQRPSQRPIYESRFGGPPPVSISAAGLSGNLADGAASGVLAQWAVPDGSDGHFVVFDVPEATAQAAQFLRNLADEPAGRVPQP